MNEEVHNLVDIHRHAFAAKFKKFDKIDVQPHVADQIRKYSSREYSGKIEQCLETFFDVVEKSTGIARPSNIRSLTEASGRTLQIYLDNWKKGDSNQDYVLLIYYWFHVFAKDDQFARLIDEKLLLSETTRKGEVFEQHFGEEIPGKAEIHAMLEKENSTPSITTPEIKEGGEAIHDDVEAPQQAAPITDRGEEPLELNSGDEVNPEPQLAQPHRYQKIAAVTLLVGISAALLIAMQLNWNEISEWAKLPAVSNSGGNETRQTVGAANEAHLSNDADTPESEVSDDTGKTEPTESELTPVVNATWDNISDKAWATWELRKFYPAIRNANSADLLEAAEAGNKNAQTLAAIGYHSGILERNNHTKGMRMARLACDQNQAYACYLIAGHHGQGLAFSQNLVKAFQLYDQACRMGNQLSCFESGWRQAHGVGTRENFPAGHGRIKGSCDADYGRACVQYASYFLFGSEIPLNEELGNQYLQKACRLGYECKNAYRVTGQKPRSLL